MRDRLVTAGTSALLGLLLVGCPMEQGFGVAPGGGSGGSPEDDPYWCCDPDEPFCLCEGYWHCTEGVAGKTCRQDNPQMPDDGNWACEYTATGLTCTGRSSDHPDGGLDEGWRCTDIGEGMVECSRSSDSGDYPDGEGAGPWDCTYGPDGRERVCEEREGGGPDSGEWECTEAADGTIVCVNHNPNTPDGGEWSCVQADGRDVCQGSDYPDASGGGGWNCTDQGEFVECENGAPQQPDAGGSQPWDCRWGDGGNVLTCVQRGDDGSLGGGGGGGGNGDNGDNGGNPGNPGDAGNGDNPGGGGGDNGGGGGGDCVCPPNADRFCDTPTYCNWGRQVCVDDGNGNAHWGNCAETNNIPAQCNFGPQFDEWAEQCAIDAGFCVQDFWDLDGDWDTNETLGRDCAGLECVDDGGGGGFGGGWGF